METDVSPQSAYLLLARFERSAAIERLERFEQHFWCVGRTDTERKPFQYRVTFQHVERTQQNPYGLVISAVEQNESPVASFPNPQSKN